MLIIMLQGWHDLQLVGWIVGLVSVLRRVLLLAGRGLCSRAGTAQHSFSPPALPDKSPVSHHN